VGAFAHWQRSSAPRVPLTLARTQAHGTLRETLAAKQAELEQLQAVLDGALSVRRLATTAHLRVVCAICRAC
jgi:hypothetical protein